MRLLILVTALGVVVFVHHLSILVSEVDAGNVPSVLLQLLQGEIQESKYMKMHKFCPSGAVMTSHHYSRQTIMQNRIPGSSGLSAAAHHLQHSPSQNFWRALQSSRCLQIAALASCMPRTSSE